MEISPIAVIRTGFSEKFGVPRQSGLASSLRGRIVFNEGYRDPASLKGLETFSHIWLIWEFSCNRHNDWHPTVRPPRLGGNASVGVFASRSPFRPNPLGLSCVEIEHIDLDSSEGPVIYIKGADLVDNTPIYDIKPYIKYADSHSDALCGYAESAPEKILEVNVPDEIVEVLGDDLTSVVEILGFDPRPSYQDDPERVYGLSFSGYNIRFKVSGKTLYLVEITKIEI